MLKKVKKYLKFVVCCALMLSLVAPSYAALSASDGSAFVTKAEFDSALADFNARLTTFEAGINSKIDSQVTSYLDRNGIWSGKDQDIFNCWGFWLGCRVNEKDNNIIGDSCGDIDYTIVYNDGTVENKTESKGTEPVFNLISNVSKSGLMCLTYDYTYGIGLHHYWATFKVHVSSNTVDEWKNVMLGTKVLRNNAGTYHMDTNNALYMKNSSNMTSCITQTISFEQTLNSSKTTEVFLFEGKKECPNDYSFVAAHLATPVVKYFFVDKDKSLLMRYYVSVVDMGMTVSTYTNDRAMWQALTNIKAKVY